MVGKNNGDIDTFPCNHEPRLLRCGKLRGSQGEPEALPMIEAKGIAARLMVFPDEGHWILKGENNRHHMQEILSWLASYLK